MPQQIRRSFRDSRSACSGRSRRRAGRLPRSLRPVQMLFRGSPATHFGTVRVPWPSSIDVARLHRPAQRGQFKDRLSGSLTWARAPSASGGLPCADALRPWPFRRVWSWTRWSTAMPSSPWAISRPRKRMRDLHLVAFLEELEDLLHLRVIVVVVDVRTHLDLLDLLRLLLLALLVGLFLGLIFVAADVEELGDRRIGVGRDLDQVEADFLRPARTLRA